MRVKAIIAILVAGLFLVLSLSSFAFAASMESDGKTTRGQDVSAAGATTRLVKVQYYDSGGNPHQVDLTVDGVHYHVGPYKDVIIVAIGYYKGPGGKGLVEIYDKDTSQNFASKLIPSGSRTSAVLPAAIYIGNSGSIHIGVLAEGPGATQGKVIDFYIEP